jgi:hypothetical protein
MSVHEQEVRSLTKNAQNAPALGIGLPVRKRSSVDFFLCLFQLLPPLNTKIGYLVQKADEEHVKDGKLPAEARNAILERALDRGMSYVFFVDDDVLFPDITLYRMWIMAQKHPELACITAVGTTKLTPTEPLIYQEGVQGAWWDWQLGALVPIHSAWAGCMLVNLDYVKKLKEPWFNDVVMDEGGDPDERVKRNIWGQDRYFHKRLREEAGGVIAADTGILVAHWDADLQKAYIVPPDAPCFNKPILGESFVTFINDDSYVSWRRIVIPDSPDKEFKTYLQWLQDRYPSEEPKISMIPEKAVKEEKREGYTVKDSRSNTDFSEWFDQVQHGDSLQLK